MFPLPPHYLIVLSPFHLKHLSRMILKPHWSWKWPQSPFEAICSNHSSCCGWFCRAGTQTGHTLVLTQLPLSGTHGLHHPDGQGGLQHGYPHVCKADGACREGGVLVSFCHHSKCLWSLQTQTPTGPSSETVLPWDRSQIASQEDNMTISFNFKQAQPQSYKVCNWREPSNSFDSARPPYKWR